MCPSWKRNPAAKAISQNVEANFKIDVIFINKPRIWSLTKYILT